MIKNIIVTAVLLLIVFGVSYYLYKEKKQGAKCIGCPYAKECKTGKCKTE